MHMRRMSINVLELKMYDVEVRVEEHSQKTKVLVMSSARATAGLKQPPEMKPPHFMESDLVF